MNSRETDRDCTSSVNGGRFSGSNSQHCNIKEYLHADTNAHIDQQELNAVLHVIAAGSILWFTQTVAISEHPGKFRHIDTRIRDFPSTENLPAGHSISPLHVQTNIKFTVLDCGHCMLTTSDFSEKIQSSKLSGANHLKGSFMTLFL